MSSETLETSQDPASASSVADGTPAAEVALDEALVRRLLAEQRPDLAAAPVEAMESGWDNALFRVGESSIVRLPRRHIAVDLLRTERRWLPELAPTLPLPVPSPTFAGRPGCGYPWPWTVTPWLPGTAADLAPPGGAAAPVLVDFLRALHRPAPAKAPSNDHRSVGLPDKHPALEPRVERLRGRSELPAPLLDLWATALGADIDLEPTWIHGDLHPRNVLVSGGLLSAIIDWGDLCVGDPATDLAAIWLLFEDPTARAAALERYGVSETTLRRARGWAIFFGVVFLDSGLLDAPRHARLGRRALRNVLAGP